MRRQLINICLKITHSLLPQHCLLCGAQSGIHPLCEGCEADLPSHDESQCPVCAMPSPLSEVCGSCIKHPPHFDATLAAFAYAFPMDALLRALKYRGRLAIAGIVAEHLGNRLSGTDADLIVPMPLHPLRLSERGFNQAIEISRQLSRKTGIPHAPDIAVRTRETAPQAALPLKERARNIRNAFECCHDLHGKKVAIVDDVMTSGASLNELARTLKAAGAVSVECWVAARTLRD